jgi:hypothetical protein
MDLRDLLLGIDVIGHARGRMEVLGSESDEMNNDDEEYTEEEERGSPMQVLEYSEGQHAAERLKLGCVVKSLTSPTAATKKQPAPSGTIHNKTIYIFLNKYSNSFIMSVRVTLLIKILDADKKYPCRYCGEKYSTNYMVYSFAL